MAVYRFVLVFFNLIFVFSGKTRLHKEEEKELKKKLQKSKRGKTFTRIQEMSDQGEKKDKKLRKGTPVLKKS